MASVLKMSLAFALFGLVALGAVLGWYFWSATGLTHDSFSLSGTDPSTGAQIRLVANWGADGVSATKVDFEVQNVNSDGSWQIFRSAFNYAETDPWFGFFNINSGDSAWICTKTGNGNQDGTTSNTFAKLGGDLFKQFGTTGGLTYYSIGFTDANGVWQQKVLIPVVFNSAGVTNFGGYQVTSFTFGRGQTLTPFRAGLPALPSLSSCVDYTADEAQAVVESDTAPVCASFASLFAFLQKRVYTDLSATTSWCTGQATATTCSPSVSRTDTVLAWKGTDRAFRCTNPTYGTIIAFAGSDDATDWLRNISGTTVPFAGMQAHAGFHRKWTLWQAWVDGQASTATTTFTGHSLGGAIANIAAAYWKGRFPSATVAIVSSGAPATFRSHTNVYTGIPNRRYVNFRKNPWYLPNQRDVVSVVSGVLGFQHPSSAPVLPNTRQSSGWNTEAISVTAVVGDVDVMGMHTTYTTSIASARGTQTTY